MGFVLVFVCYGAAAGTMKPETLMRLCIAVMLSACLLLAMAVFARYGFSRDRLREIQKALRARRAAGAFPAR